MPCRGRLVVAALLALAAAAGVTGCGGGDSQRDALRAYIEKVNDVQRDGAPGVQAANQAYAQFSQGKLVGAAAVRALTVAHDDLRASRDRLAALSAPPAARTLRQRLLRLLDADVGLADEASQLAAYVPAASAATAPLARAGQRLGDELAGATSSRTQEQALAQYGRSLARAEARVRRLEPPPVLVPDYRSQLLRLNTTRSLAKRLRTAIADRDAALVARLLLRFQAVNDTTRADVGVQRAAVKAYRSRVQTLNADTAAVQREVERLNETLS